MNKSNPENNDSLRELVGIGGNRRCFDCFEKGVTYVNMTIGSFCCTKCSGILRGLNPAHRVKSISMARFTNEEVEFLRSHGNDECSKTWLGLWDAKRKIKQDHKDFMSDKYEKKRYYLEPSSPLKSIKLSSSQSQSSMSRANSDDSSPSSSSMKTSSSTNSALNSFSVAAVQPENRLPNQQQQSQNKSNGNNFEFFADFDKASSLFSNNFSSSNTTIPSTKAAALPQQQQTANFQASSGDMNANFADFENNKIYVAAADIPSPMMNILKANNNQNSLLARPATTNQAATDKYAALKMLDDEFKEATKQQDETVHNHVDETTTTAWSSNPFKSAATSQHQQQQLNFGTEPFGLFNNNGNGNFIIPETTTASFDDDFFSGNPFKTVNNDVTSTTQKRNPFL